MYRFKYKATTPTVKFLHCYCKTTYITAYLLISKCIKWVKLDSEVLGASSKKNMFNDNQPLSSFLRSVKGAFWNMFLSTFILSIKATPCPPLNKEIWPKTLPWMQPRSGLRHIHGSLLDWQSYRQRWTYTQAQNETVTTGLRILLYTSYVYN